MSELDFTVSTWVDDGGAELEIVQNLFIQIFEQLYSRHNDHIVML